MTVVPDLIKEFLDCLEHFEFAARFGLIPILRKRPTFYLAYSKYLLDCFIKIFPCRYRLGLLGDAIENVLVACKPFCTDLEPEIPRFKYELSFQRIGAVGFVTRRAYGRGI